MNKFKIISLSLALLLCVGILPAQEEADAPVEKKQNTGKLVLPQAGDISLAIDVAPIFRYIGNCFNGTQNNPGLNSFGGEPAIANPILTPNVSIMGKYMITDNIAARFNVGILTIKDLNNEYSLDDEAKLKNPLSEVKIIDSRAHYISGASFSVGAEYRRGYRWVQGFFGLDFDYGFAEENIKYSYGNAITEINQTPTRAFGAATTTPAYWTQAYKLKEFNKTADSYVGLSAHLGVELFLTSYMALGGEVSLAALWKIGSPQYAVIEGFNKNTLKLDQRTELIEPGDNMFVFGTENLGGKLFLAFYF